MARCPYLEYKGVTLFGNYDDYWICRLDGKEMDLEDLQVKNICDAKYGYDYYDCPLFKSKK